MKAVLFFACSLGCLTGLWSQSAAGVALRVEPVFENKPVVLDQPLPVAAGDSLALHTLRFYLGNFTFWNHDQVVFSESRNYRLLDLEEPNSLIVSINWPQTVAFDSLTLNLGVDSATTAAGVFSGDLDPTRGMFWTWQSGYINAKIEGYWSRCPARHHEFQCHLGGFLAPFQTCQRVGVAAAGAGVLRLELAPFLTEMARTKQYEVMSPSAGAVALSRLLAQSFVWNAP